MDNIDNNKNYFSIIKWLSDMGHDEFLNFDLNYSQSLSNNTKLENFSNDSNNINSISKVFGFKKLKEFIANSKFFNSIENFNNFNFYDGNTNADLMVIGDQPSEEDLKHGKPFQGEIGNLLDAMLKAIKFDRKETYYTNLYILNYKNLNKKIDYRTDFFLSILHKQIELVSPKVIIMFGRDVTNLLSGNELEISATRGKWFNIKIRDKNINYNAISMFHPRDLLLKSENKKETWKDLKDIRKKYSE